MRTLLLTICALLGGCALETPPPDTAQLPPDAFGTYLDGDVGAISLASYAFASPQRTFNRPAEAAQAVAAVDYLAGELSTNPRWTDFSPLTKIEMLDARTKLRRALGIAPGAPSQVVVSSMLAASTAIQNHDLPTTLHDLGVWCYTRDPRTTLALLTHMPYLPVVNVATLHADAQSEPHGG